MNQASLEDKWLPLTHLSKMRYWRGEIIIVQIVRFMLKHKSLPREFWGEVINPIMYLLNQALIESLEGIASYKI